MSDSDVMRLIETGKLPASTTITGLPSRSAKNSATSDRPPETGG
jgi:hypothetical protein